MHQWVFFNLFLFLLSSIHFFLLFIFFIKTHRSTDIFCALQILQRFFPSLSHLFIFQANTFCFCFFSFSISSFNKLWYASAIDMPQKGIRNLFNSHAIKFLSWVTKKTINCVWEYSLHAFSRTLKRKWISSIQRPVCNWLDGKKLMFLMCFQFRWKTFQCKIQCFFIQLWCFCIIFGKHWSIIFGTGNVGSIFNGSWKCFFKLLLVFVRHHQNVRWLNVLFTYRKTGFWCEIVFHHREARPPLRISLAVSSGDALSTLVRGSSRIKISVFAIKFYYAIKCSSLHQINELENCFFCNQMKLVNDAHTIS